MYILEYDIYEIGFLNFQIPQSIDANEHLLLVVRMDPPLSILSYPILSYLKASS